MSLHGNHKFLLFVTLILLPMNSYVLKKLEALSYVSLAFDTYTNMSKLRLVNMNYLNMITKIKTLGSLVIYILFVIAFLNIGEYL